MTQEKKAWLEKTANIIEEIVRRYPYSDALVHLEPKDPLFDDSCHYIGLVHELKDFATTLRGMVRFSELGESNPKK